MTAIANNFYKYPKRLNIEKLFHTFKPLIFINILSNFNLNLKNIEFACLFELEIIFE